MLSQFTWTLSFVSLLAPAFTQATHAAAPFRMPCSQVLKLGANKFAEVYVRKMGASEVDYDNAAHYYYHCKREHDDLRARRLSPRDRRQVNRVRDELKDLDDSCAELEYTAMGGGTLYIHTANRRYAYREDLIGQVVEWMIDPPGMSADACAAAEREWAAGGKQLAKLASVPNNVELKGSEYARYRRHYLTDLAAVKLHWARLKPLVRSLSESRGVLSLARNMTTTVKETVATIDQH